eukprot:COSAG05_NODE_1029_length_6096_cov_10.323002_1_plen_82_part_00
MGRRMRHLVVGIVTILKLALLFVGANGPEKQHIGLDKYRTSLGGVLQNAHAMALGSAVGAVVSGIVVCLHRGSFFPTKWDP